MPPTESSASGYRLSLTVLGVIAVLVSLAFAMPGCGSR
jgi:hypothetical protein